jgi:sirohydrochlorin cobaltochelatase
MVLDRAKALDLSDAALVLVGHGSTQNADSARPVYKHAQQLRGHKIFAEVLECFWKIEPGIATVIGKVSAPRIFVVPLFISEGYFTQEMIPRELGLCAPGQSEFSSVQQRGGQTLFYCAPVGTHSAMTEIVLLRASEVVAQHPFPRAPKPSEIALFLAGHGTEQNANSRQAVERQVEIIRQRKEYAEVHAVFLEEEPRVGDCYKLAQAKNIVVVPFFISEGMHSREDIPLMLGESKANVQQRLKENQPTWRNPTERRGKRVWYSASVGTAPRISDVILERVKEMVQH